MTIANCYLQNFKTLCKAVANGHVMLVECTDVKTKEPVITICAFEKDPTTEEMHIIPFAKMFDGNPYEELTPPTMP